MRWTTRKIYVDKETGEIITEWIAQEKYIIIKKTKDVKLNKEAFRGTITFTYECRRKQYEQGKLL